MSALIHPAPAFNPLQYELRGKKALVTGATGFIGRHVTRRLVQEQVAVRALVRNPDKAIQLDPAAEIVLGDMTDAASLAAALEGCQVVFHFAGAVNDYLPWSRYHQINVEGTRTLATLALAARIERFIHTSTIWVYGIEGKPDTNEHSPQQPSGDAYADTKGEAQQIIRQLVEKGLPAVIIQPAEVYGFGDPTWTMRPFQLIQSRKLFLVDGGNGVLQPIFITDLVAGILDAAQYGRSGEAYLLCGNEVVTVETYLGYLARMAGRNHIPSIPRWLAFGLATLFERVAPMLGCSPTFTRREVRALTQRAIFSNAKAQRELGFTPQTTLVEGMRQIAQGLASQTE